MQLNFSSLWSHVHESYPALVCKKARTASHNALLLFTIDVYVILYYQSEFICMSTDFVILKIQKCTRYYLLLTHNAAHFRLIIDWHYRFQSANAQYLFSGWNIQFYHFVIYHISSISICSSDIKFMSVSCNVWIPLDQRCVYFRVSLMSKRNL